MRRTVMETTCALACRQLSLALAGTSVFENTFGILDAPDGTATAVFSGSFSPIAANGWTLYFAFAIDDSAGDWSSNSEAISVDLLWRRAATRCAVACEGGTAIFRLFDRIRCEARSRNRRSLESAVRAERLNHSSKLL